MSMKKNLIGTSLIIATLGSTQIASADTYSVAYSPIEMSTPIGAEQVYERIQHAAFQSCRDEFKGQRFVKQHRAMQRCVKAVTRELVEKADHPRLTKLALAKPAKQMQLASK